MTFTDFIPPKTWAFIVKTADENKLSTKEIQRIFLNKVRHDLGMTCNHERIGRARKDPEHKPYCKDCWERLRMEKMEPYLLGGKLIRRDTRYLETETFLDEFYRDRDSDREAISKRSQGQSEVRTGDKVS